MKALLFVLLAALVAADKYAVLVAGSNGFWNYRHHADVCHAYLLLTMNGIPADNIVLMLYDDVASASQNPFKGQLFNKPDTGEGWDVYAGCKDHIDYKGNTVTPVNFLNIIQGNADAMKGIGTGKVLRSGPNDQVFIFFSDHGSTGLIAFPAGGYLYADKLTAAFKYMHDHQMYSKLTFYLEACESGSMFQNLLDPSWGIYATSASSPTESSWGYYCNPNDMVNGKHVGSCLGDLYSIAWLEDTDRGEMTETLQSQYVAVKTRTTMSQVMQWGDVSYTADPIGEFMSNKMMRSTATSSVEKAANAVSSRDMKLQFLYNQYLSTNTPSTYVELQKELKHREWATATFAAIAKKAAGAEGERLFTEKSIPVTNFDCLRAANDAVEKYCATYSDYSLQYVRVMKNLCEKVPQERVLAAVMSVCA
jgi:legumain